MQNRHIYPLFIKTLSFFLFTCLASPLFAEVDVKKNEKSPLTDNAWDNLLKNYYFPNIQITESNKLLDFEAPYRAEDGAMVPINIKTKLPQTKEDYIQSMWIVIDNNPKPLAGKFQFSPLNGKADLSMRIRVDAYSLVRVIAATNKNQYYMVSHFVKSSGGCSAPASSDAETALARLGKIRMKTKFKSFEEPVQTRLAISHPNTSGLQKDQVTTLFIPPHYISKINVKFNGESVFSAETDISISENPNFKFYFAPDKPGLLTTEVTDTKGNKFTQTKELEIPKK